MDRWQILFRDCCWGPAPSNGVKIVKMCDRWDILFKYKGHPVHTRRPSGLQSGFLTNTTEVLLNFPKKKEQKLPKNVFLNKNNFVSVIFFSIFTALTTDIFIDILGVHNLYEQYERPNLIRKLAELEGNCATLSKLICGVNHCVLA